MSGLLSLADWLLAVPALISALLGLVFIGFSLGRIRRGRVVLAGIHGALATGLLGLGAALFLLGMNLHTYQRLTYEVEVARLQFWQSGDQRYLAVVVPAGEEDSLSYLLAGDEWQIDARILRWHPLGNLAGLNARYRLERLSGRYHDVDLEQSSTRTVFRIAEDPGLDIWVLLGKLESWLDWVDAYYGSSAYMPMADRAEYQVVLTQSGLVARPLNDAATRALRTWR